MMNYIRQLTSLINTLLKVQQEREFQFYYRLAYFIEVGSR